MRYIFLLLCLSFACISCQVYNNYPVQGKTLTNINFLPNEDPIDVFFIEEATPQRDYIRIAMLEESMASNSPQASSLLERLRQKGQNLGADAVLVLDRQTSEIVRNDPNAVTYSIPRETMSALAIRYVDNITFSNRQLSHLEVISHAKQSNNESELLHFGPTGELTSNFENRWSLLAYQYSLHYLLESTQDWAFYHVPVTGGQTLYRKQVIRDQIKTNIRTISYKNGRYGEITINKLNGLSRNIRMQLHYNEEGQIEKRSWTDGIALANIAGDYEVLHHYDGSGRLMQEQYYRKTIQATEFTPLLTVNYHYLDQKNLEEVLEQEQIVRVKR